MTNNGVKHDQEKPRYDLIPPEALEGVAEVLTYGAKKYGDRNWEKGMSWGRLFGALMRHMWAWWRGEANDPETGFSHLHHAACCIMFLQTYVIRGNGVDDRCVGKKDKESITPFTINVEDLKTMDLKTIKGLKFHVPGVD